MTISKRKHKFSLLKLQTKYVYIFIFKYLKLRIYLLMKPAKFEKQVNKFRRKNIQADHSIK